MVKEKTGNKVCIVTPDFTGPINNGGIGTHCLFLALELVESGFEVTVLFTVLAEVKDTHFWHEHYRKFGITFISIHDMDIAVPVSLTDWFLIYSLKVSEYLREHHFDFIHFQEWQANGFHTIQAKKTTNDFCDSTLTVTMHSPSQWSNQGMRRWNRYPRFQTKLEWCERYCARNADILVSPSRFMLNWALKNGWILSEKRQVTPNCYRDGFVKTGPAGAPRRVDLSHLIFFGRLETRKGLEYFCNELLSVLSENPSAVSRVSFLGKIGMTEKGRADRYLSGVLGETVPYRVYPDFDSFQAIEFIRRSGGIAVIPSLMDNFPYTVVECIENEIPVLASNSGGIPEMLNEKSIFDISKKGALRDRILLLKKESLTGIRHMYSRTKAKHGWLDIHRSPVPDLPMARGIGNPLVSICIAYYNHGRYLPQLLNSLRDLEYKNIEVIVVNDGSTDRESNEVFDALEKEYSFLNWTFCRKENTGVSHTRNYAVSKANGEYIIFMDADNIATSSMVTDFVSGINKTGADCVTCHYNVFSDDRYIEGDTRPVDRYMPIGPALEIGMLENVFGDANFIIRKDVFEVLGGFGEDMTTSWEDYEFLARLSLKGHKQEVIPKPLFWYRLTPGSMSSTADIYRNRRRILRTYYDSSPPYTRFMLESLLVPYFYRYPLIENTIMETLERLSYRLYTEIGGFLRNRLTIRKLIRSCVLRINTWLHA